MNAPLIRGFVCIAAAALALYTYIDRLNGLTELRLAIPMLSKEVRAIQQENTRLKYEIEQFENPVLLMELLQKPEFSHLKYPYINEEVFLRKSE